MRAARVLWLGLAFACGRSSEVPVEPTGTEPQTTTPARAPAPAFHRLTPVEINQALATLFPMPDKVVLPQVVQPPAQPVHGFDNHAATRGLSPWAAELLQRDFAAVASTAVQQIQSWAPCHPHLDATTACARRVVDQVATQAWRRPLTPEELDWLHRHLETWAREHGDLEAVELSIAAILHAPQFLYLLEPSPELDPWQIASRLSLLLWSDLPDDALREAAAAGALGTPKEVRAQAERMLADPRARDAVVRFVFQWLGGADIDTAGWDLETYGLEVDLITRRYYEDWLVEGDLRARVEAETRWQRENVDYRKDLAAGFERLLEHVIFGGEGSLAALLTTPEAYVTRRTVWLYDPDYDRTKLTAEPTRIELSKQQWPGVLTRGAFLAAHGHPTHASPVLRGAFLADRLLCSPPGSPPPDIPSIDDAAPSGSWTTNRERYEVAVQNEPCASCHRAFNPLGYVLENYDGMGRWRDVDGGQPVDATATLASFDVTGEVTGAAELTSKLAASRRVHDCAVTHLFRYALHRGETSHDAEAIALLQEQFWASGGHLPTLFLDLVASEAFRTRADVPGGTP